MTWIIVGGIVVAVVIGGVVYYLHTRSTPLVATTQQSGPLTYGTAGGTTVGSSGGDSVPQNLFGVDVAGALKTVQTTVSDASNAVKTGQMLFNQANTFLAGLKIG